MRNKNWIEFNNESNQSVELESQNIFIRSKNIRIYKEKGKRGKVITLISGFESENATQLSELLKKLKSFCGTGGTLKEHGIQLQGDMRERIINFLRKDGYEI